MRITIIAALHIDTRGIGMNGRAPWALHAHQHHLDALMEGGVMIMGRKTYESLLANDQVVRDRAYLVLTRQDEFAYLEKHNVMGVYSVEDAQEGARRFLRGGKTSQDSGVFVIGGQEAFELFLPLASRLVLTLVTGEAPQCDAFFPAYRDDFSLVGQYGLESRCQQQGLSYRFTMWERKPKT